MYKVVVSVISVLDPTEMEIASYDINDGDNLQKFVKITEYITSSASSCIVNGKECCTRTGFTNDGYIITISWIKL